MSPSNKQLCLAASGLVLGLSIASASLAQTYYRWTDKDGKVHYSDQQRTATSAGASTSRSAPTPADILLRNSQRNAVGAANDWADSTRRFAPSATTPAALDRRRRGTAD